MTTTTADTDLIRARLLDGWRVESAAQGTTILARGRGLRPKHGFHLIMDVITCGLWLPIHLLDIAIKYPHRTRRVAIYCESGVACEVAL